MSWTPQKIGYFDNNGNFIVDDFSTMTIPVAQIVGIAIPTQAELIGTINGSNSVFTTATNFTPENVTVFVNGQRQTIINDYQLSNNNTITFTFSPNVNEILIIEY